MKIYESSQLIILMFGLFWQNYLSFICTDLVRLDMMDFWHSV